ncbi:MAG: DUF3470 domain-containing protein [Candidatus Hodgkinia cicadicola]
MSGWTIKHSSELEMDYWINLNDKYAKICPNISKRKSPLLKTDEFNGIKINLTNTLSKMFNLSL